jgi:rhodanese-related sulfurtransferase
MQSMIEQGHKQKIGVKLLWFSVVVIVLLAAGAAVGISIQGQAANTGGDPAPPGSSTAMAGLERVGIAEAAAMLSQPDVVALDARPRDFYELGHLPGARCLSREEFEKDFAAIESELRRGDRKILIYCSAVDCEDGEIVARALQARRMGPLYVYTGGYDEWEAAGNPVETTP